MKRTDSPIASGPDHLPLDLLRRYQQGALPGPEEHRVERHLLDCELCSDVLAGMEKQSANQTAAAVQQINRRVAAAGQRSGAQVIPLFSRRNLAAAAALLVLLCSGALVLFYNLQQAGRQPQPLAATPAGPQNPSRQPVLQPAPGAVADAAPAHAPAEPAAAGPRASAAPQGQAPAAPQGQAPAAPASPAPLPGQTLAQAERAVPETGDLSYEILAAAKPGAEQVSDSARSAPPAIAAAAPASAPAAEGAPATIAIRGLGGAKVAKKEITGAAPSPGSQVIQGRVLDEQGLPLPGVSVRLKGSSLGTTTDHDGNYRLMLPQHLSQADLTFAYIGFNTQEKKLALPGKELVNVTLAPSMMALNEVVVTGYGTKRKEAEEKEITAAASPQGGWSAFSKYLRANTGQAGDKASGRVVVGFTVQADGSLAGLRVLKSLSPQADAQALRLVQQYPGWLPARAGTQARAQELRATVRFRGSR
ncbi:MAG: TonB family protein [Adhaeribacter sp.]